MAQTVLGSTLLLIAVAMAGIAYYSAISPHEVGFFNRDRFGGEGGAGTGDDGVDAAVASAARGAGTRTRADPITGIEFPLSRTFGVGKNMSLLGVGTRKKAILNVYSVGFYGSKPVAKAIKDKTGEGACIAAMDAKLKGSRAALLKFSMGVGAEKMAEAMTNVEGPSQESKASFVDMIVKGIGGKLKKGEEMTFEWKGADTVAVTARGLSIGEMKDKGMFQGLLEIYLGEKSVSPSLKKDIGGTAS